MKKRKYINVYFSCKCGLEDIPVKVPAREYPTDDVKHYVEKIIGREVAHQHFIRSPNCRRNVMKHLKIPLPPDDDPNPWIGKHNSIKSSPTKG